MPVAKSLTSYVNGHICAVHYYAVTEYFNLHTLIKQL